MFKMWCFFFFFKQKTAYEMRISDWSSDVCSSDLNGVEAGTGESEVSMQRNQRVNVKAKVTARLPADQDEEGTAIAGRPLDEQPYWPIERARVGKTQHVQVALLVNGESVETREIKDDGEWHNIAFDYQPTEYAWMALRIFTSE